MPMGESAGRSAGNRTGEGARRRNTPRERSLVDPPWDEMVPRYKLTPRGEKLYTLTAFVSIVGFAAMMVFLLGTWFGLWLR